jgi:hypothetical protein
MIAAYPDRCVGSSVWRRILKGTGSLFPGFQVMVGSTVQNHVNSRCAGNQLQQDVVQVSVQIETAMEGNFRKYGAAPSKPVYFSLGSSSSDKRGIAA